MGQDIILNLFYENPTKEFHIREIARILKLSKTNIGYHINKLLKTNIIITKKGVFKSYIANEDSKEYRYSKLLHGLKRIYDCGIIQYLEKINPRCIVLFGSFAKAEYDINSDVDLFVQAPEQKLDLAKYEKKLKHKINVFFEPNINKLSPELLNNIINGIKLSGHIKLK